MAEGLRGKVVIVTGGGHGIGKIYCERLAEAGAKVVVAELFAEAGEQLVADLKNQGYEALAVQTDVTQRNSVNRMATDAIAAFGTIDVLVNNAAIMATVPMSRVAFDELSIEEWDQMMAVNLKGSWLACCAVTPYMREQRSGKIINISSGTALRGAPSRIHYVTSKAGIIGFTKTLANELGADNICVNCIAPGNTLSEKDPDESTLNLRHSAIQMRALKRLQTPEDLVGAMLFFAGSESDFITGQTLVVDGGSVMH
jgi:3-oxoacyl-[acyl-carrier protein] reductase